MKLPVLVLATLLAVTGCAADPEPTSSRDRREHAGDRARHTADRDRPATPKPAEPADDASTPAGSFAAAVYYLADTERAGVRLQREFRPGTGDRMSGTLELLMTSPLDPDYRTAWRPGQLRGVISGGDVLEVVVDPSVRTRPAGMTEAEARAALQQVVYSVQGAQQERLPVSFRLEDRQVDRVLGVPTGSWLRAGSPLQTLGHVSLTSPEQGTTVIGDRLEVSGVGNSFEATIGWEIRRGDRVVRRGFATADGWMGDRLFPFRTTLDVSGLAAGDYTLWVTTDDPSGGAEGFGAMTDDKEFTVG